MISMKTITSKSKRLLIKNTDLSIRIDYHKEPMFFNIGFIIEEKKDGSFFYKDLYSYIYTIYVDEETGDKLRKKIDDENDRVTLTKYEDFDLSIAIESVLEKYSDYQEYKKDIAPIQRQVDTYFNNFMDYMNNIDEEIEINSDLIES